MSSNHFKNEVPHVVYEANDYSKITALHTSALKHVRFVISQALGTSDERAYPFYALDNIGRIIRAFETEGRIFFTNENGYLSYLSTCSSKLARKAYGSIREKIASLYGGQPGGKGLVWLLNNMESIQVIIDGEEIQETIFLVKNASEKDIKESDEDMQFPNGFCFN